METSGVCATAPELNLIIVCLARFASSSCNGFTACASRRQTSRRVRARSARVTGADALPNWRAASLWRLGMQILQQSVFLKFKYFVKFLQQHGQEVFAEVRTAYVETLSRIYRSALCA